MNTNNKLTRLERISAVVEDTIEKLLLNSDKGDKNIYIYRYVYWMSTLETEIKNNVNVDTARLKVSKFMEQLICHIIVRHQTIEDIHRLYRGWKSTDRYSYDKRDSEIKKLFKL